jgi:hypothetical protein
MMHPIKKCPSPPGVPPTSPKDRFSIVGEYQTLPLAFEIIVTNPERTSKELGNTKTQAPNPSLGHPPPLSTSGRTCQSAILASTLMSTDSHLSNPGHPPVDSTNPQSWNRYPYLQSDPLSQIDLFGLCGGGDGDPGPPCQPFSIDIGGGCNLNVTYVSATGDDGLTYDIPQFELQCMIGGGGGGGGASILDNRANALANALNKTSVQSLGNPCTVVSFYLGSAVFGAAKVEKSMLKVRKLLLPIGRRH